MVRELPDPRREHTSDFRYFPGDEIDMGELDQPQPAEQFPRSAAIRAIADVRRRMRAAATLARFRRDVKLWISTHIPATL